MSQYLGKNICSLVRGGDYAHAGEIEAIEKVMAPFPKNNNQLILDVGCGLGGTANYIQKNKWGRVYGFDIESDSISYAKKKYPHINFYIADALDVHNIIKNIQFDIICLFNVFYSLPDQQLALSILNKLTKPQARLAMVEYSDFCKNEINPLFNTDPTKDNIHIPIRPETIENMLAKNGWQLTKLDDISDDYQRWYKQLLERLQNKQKTIIKIYGKKCFDKAISTFTKIYQTIIDKQSGGIIVYAQKN